MHPVFNPVATYRYLLSTMYLFMVDIANSDLFLCGCRTWICLDIAHFYEEQVQPFTGSAWPACTENGKLGPHCWGRDVSTLLVRQFLTAVTAPPVVGCVVWSLGTLICSPTYEICCSFHSCKLPVVETESDRV